MPWIMQMVWFAILLIGIGVALWISFWVLLVLFGVGITAVLWSNLKSYLLRHGILNATPGVAPVREDDGQIIEGNYTRVEAPVTKMQDADKLP